MSRVTHVVVFGVDDEGKPADWLMPLEEFAALFTWGQTFHSGPSGDGHMTQDVWLRNPKPEHEEEVKRG